jgi:hypothetical protein
VTLSSSPIGRRGAAPEATSVLLFALVLVLLWFALAKTGSDVHASDGSAAVPGSTDIGDLERVATGPHD